MDNDNLQKLFKEVAAVLDANTLEREGQGVPAGSVHGEQAWVLMEILCMLHKSSGVSRDSFLGAAAIVYDHCNVTVQEVKLH